MSAVHMASDTPLLDVGFDVNVTLICNSSLPDVTSYFSSLNVYMAVAFAWGCAAVLALGALYASALRGLRRAPSPSCSGHAALILSIYPVVGLASFSAMLVPRVQPLTDAVIQGVFVITICNLFCLFVSYCGGEAALITAMKSDRIIMRLPPCCCWPCCCCLPAMAVTKKSIALLRILVLQGPLVQGVIYAVLLFLWAEDEELYQTNYLYFQPLVVSSILTAAWAMTMSVRLMTPHHAERALRPKFIALQAVIVLAKLQGLIGRLLAGSALFECTLPLTPYVYSNLICNSIVLLEMLCLSWWARGLYTRAKTSHVAPDAAPPARFSLQLSPENFLKKHDDKENAVHIGDNGNIVV